EGSVPVRVDRRAVLQAILNLLDNALKYSGDSREVRLHVYERDGEAVVDVQDFGIGIPADEQVKVFEKFYRVEDAMTRTSEGGVGLGLAMVQHIMQGHGGRVSLVSIAGKGSTFSLVFKRMIA
ncbi:MAG TPA: sensor histidine kinase, partial [Elusimicrobiota bacterium]|nr:sensor histidine kinase [Elusimicrobiota bacterium]